MPSAVDIDMWQVCRLVFFLIKSLRPLILFIIIFYYQTDAFQNAPLSSYKKRIVFFGSTLAGL